MVSTNEISSTFESVDPNNNQHTNFKISRSGERIYLYSPTQQLLSSLFVSCQDLDNSTGSFPNASDNIVLFETATPTATNDLSIPYSTYLTAPILSVPAGLYSQPIEVIISNPNTAPSNIYYTTDGSEPSTSSTLYEGKPQCRSLVFIGRAAHNPHFSSHHRQHKPIWTQWHFRQLGARLAKSGIR